MSSLLTLLTTVLFLLPATSSVAQEMQKITDLAGRQLKVPATIERVICSGPGCLRLLSYLQLTQMVVGVDEMEVREDSFDPRPYALAYPALSTLPVFGGLRGQDQPELILGLTPLPQIIFKAAASMGHDPIALQHKTGIPVIVLDDGDLDSHREQLYRSLRLMAQITGRQERGESVIEYIDHILKDLNNRTASIVPDQQHRAFVGGIAFKGSRGLLSTDPNYLPFALVNAQNIAASPSNRRLSQADMDREHLLIRNPDFLFFDLASSQQNQKNGFQQLRNNHLYHTLDAVETGQVYGLLPHNWYGKNYGSILSNAYFVGKTLYPEQFKDIDPRSKADEIFNFLLGTPLFNQLNQQGRDLALTTIPLD